MFRWRRRAPGRLQAVDPVRRLEERLAGIEDMQREIMALLTGKTVAIDKLIVENMRTDKVELNLDRLDVGDLSGVLSIGINYGPRLVRVAGRNGDGWPRPPRQAPVPANPGSAPVPCQPRAGGGPAINITYGSGAQVPPMEQKGQAQEAVDTVPCRR